MNPDLVSKMIPFWEDFIAFSSVDMRKRIHEATTLEQLRKVQNELEYHSQRMGILRFLVMNRLGEVRQMSQDVNNRIKDLR